MHNNCVLVAGSGNITGLNVIRALYGQVTSLIGCDYCSADANPSNMWCKNYRVARTSSQQYTYDIFNLIEDHGVKAIIASNDHDVRALMNVLSTLTASDVLLNGSSINTLKCLDKLATSRMFSDAEILTPKVYEREISMTVPFVIRKNLVGTGQKFSRIINTRTEQFQITEQMWRTSILTQYIEGEEYTIDVLCDLSSNVLSVVPRLRREVRAGIVHFGEVIENQTVIQRTTELASRLKLTGINCVQCIYTKDDECYFFEVNPRPGSGLDLTTHAGVNMPLAWLDIISEKSPAISEPDWGLKMVRYHDGYFFK
jgi:carbamoyl-phosphate synthase large subunit